MKKCKYYVGCYGFGPTINGFKTMRIVTDMQGKTPLFEVGIEPLEFTPRAADAYMRELIDMGWAAVTIKCPHDRPFLCQN